MTEIAWGRPTTHEYPKYYEPYMKLVSETDLLLGLRDQIAEISDVLDVEESQAEVLHPPYTWTIKQVVGHMIDNERIFAYRATRISVGDPTDLPGYEQDDYVARSDYQSVTLKELVEELLLLRRSNLMMLERVKSEAWDLRGTCDGNELTVRAIACLLIGHVRHHLQIIGRRLC